MQLEFNLAIGALNGRIEPAVLLYVVVLSLVQLHLVVRIVAAEGVDAASQVHSREESLLLRQVLTHLDCGTVVVQVIVLGAIPSNQVESGMGDVFLG